VVQLRVAQQEIADGRVEIVARAQGWLARPGAAAVQVTLINPGRTPGGSTRPDTAVRVQAVGVDGRRLVDALVSLVGPKARIRTEGAVPTGEGAATVHAALIGRPLIAWRESELWALVRSLPHSDWPERRWGSWNWDQVATVQEASTRWRGQLDERRGLVPSLPPGTPDRLLLHLQRIAADDCVAPGEDAEAPPRQILTLVRRDRHTAHLLNMRAELIKEIVLIDGDTEDDLISAARDAATAVGWAVADVRQIDGWQWAIDGTWGGESR
jgi:hypothetical protein